jgi:hypothetical protein
VTPRNSQHRRRAFTRASRVILMFARLDVAVEDAPCRRAFDGRGHLTGDQLDRRASSAPDVDIKTSYT